MDKLDDDITVLENAMRLFIQTMKRPQRWNAVLARAKISAMDRPSAHILQILMRDKVKLHRIQDLAMQLGIEPPSVTRKTQELEQAGYLQRVPNPKDRRAVDIHITPQGRKIADRLHKAQREIISETLKSWDPAERQALVQLFERFSNELLVTSLTPNQLSQKGTKHD